MKTFNLKTLAAAALGLVLPVLTYADHMHIKYHTAKPAACTIKYQYYDGSKGAVTCEYTDNLARPASNDWVNIGGSGCEIRHVDHAESQIYVIPDKYDPCYTGSTWGTGPTTVGAVGAVKTYGNDQSSNANSFYGTDTYNIGYDTVSIQYFFADMAGGGTAAALDIEKMAEKVVSVRVKLNKKTGGDLGGSNYVYFLSHP